MLQTGLAAHWASAALPPAELPTFQLALEELFLNIAQHGTRADIAPPTVDLSLEHSGETLTLTLTDDGPPFDPLTLPAPDLTVPLASRKVGGLGVHLVTTLMDSVCYSRCEGRNVLTLSRRLRA